MAADLVLSIVTKIGEYLVAPVSRQFGYMIFYDRNIKNLETEVQNLEDTRDGMQRKVDEGKRKNETLDKVVERWLGEVDNLSEEAKKFLEDDVKANKGCLNGWCPNLKSRYSLSRKATKKTQGLVEKCVKGTSFTTVTNPTPLGDIVYKPNRDYMVFKSRKLIMDKVMEALTSDSINKIGICGMGGVGKTELVKEVAKIGKENNLFDKVVMVTVSQNPDPIKIQGEIAERLDFESFSGSDLLVRKRDLCARILKIKSILVILDDVWSRLELDDIGIPLGDDHKGCKIVLTSRSYDVCRNDMGAGQTFSLDVLFEEEAWNLFEQMAEISNDSTGHTNDFPYKEVANECGRLPIAIVTVARALKGKAKHFWDSALQQLRNSIVKNITGVNKGVFQCLELSYNYLESEEHKNCFLLCSLFPEDFNIPIEALVRYVIGLNWFERVDSVDKARVRVRAIVDDLKTRFLLLHGERDDDKYVKIHDVMRDVAILIAREEHSFMVRCDEPLEDWPEDARRQNLAVISLSLTGMCKLPGDLEFPKLQLLHLLCKGEGIDTPDSFFEGMKELKVVTFSKMSFRQLPTSLHFLSNLKTLSISVCEWIDDVSMIGALTNLEILRFNNFRIRKLSKEIGGLSHLKLLELADCVVGRIIPGVLSRLLKLEELYIGQSFDEWDVVEQDKEGANASIAELASLSNLVALKICVQLNDVKSWPKVLDLKKVKKFDLIICKPYPRGDRSIEERIFGSSSTDLYYDFCHFQNQLMFRDVDVRHLMETVLKNLLKRIRVLKLDSVKGSMNIFSGLSRDDFAKLKMLEIINCGDLEYLINTIDWVSHTASDALDLEVLRLERLPALTHVWKGPTQLGPTQLACLHNLTSVQVSSCPKLKSMLSISMARHLIQLQSIYIWGCDEMEVIVSSEGGEHEIVPADKIVFPKVHTLHLEGLPSFTALCKDMIAIEMPELKTLELYKIPKLQYLCPPESNQNSVIQSLFHNKGPTQLVCFHNLTIVRVEDCPKLKSMFSISMARHLIQLQSIVIYECDEMEVIVSSEGGEHEIVPADKIVFPKVHELELAGLPSFIALCKDMIAIEMLELKTLHLEEIPKLQYLCPPESNHNSMIQSLFHNMGPTQLVCLRNLTSVQVVDCPKLKSMFSISMARHLIQLQSIWIDGCDEMEVIVSIEGGEHEIVPADKIVFPKVNYLRLQRLPSFTALCKDMIAIEMPQLKSLILTKIPKLQYLCPPESNHNTMIQSLFHNKVSLISIVRLQLIDMDNLIEIWPGNLQANSACSQGFQNLIFIKVEKCDSLRNLFSPSIAKLLVKLQKLEITRCEVMETIIGQEQEVDEEVTTNTIIFSQLTHLELEDLPNLTSFCKQEDYTFEGSFLKEVKVTRCPKMEVPSALQQLRERA